MFRKMRRFVQQISDEECREVLQQQKRGVLSVLGDDGYPYGVPIDYIFVEEGTAENNTVDGAAVEEKETGEKATDASAESGAEENRSIAAEEKKETKEIKGAKETGLRGKIYFHGAKAGHKQDAIKACDKVSFCVMDDEGYRKEGEWALNIRSVIAFGRIRSLGPEEYDRAMDICRGLCHKFTDDETYIEHEIQHAGPRVQVLELTIEHLTGKLVNES